MAEAGVRHRRRATGSTPRCEPRPDVATTDLYTRTEALRDGSLIEATPLAAEMGITVPVALTHYAWRRTVALTLAAYAAGEDEEQRLRNILATYRAAVLRSPARDTLIFTAQVMTASPIPVSVTLRAVKERETGESLS